MFVIIAYRISAGRYSRSKLNPFQGMIQGN